MIFFQKDFLGFEFVISDKKIEEYSLMQKKHYECDLSQIKRIIRES